ncbi:MAG TPA: ribonuclease H-like domain-containing protein, partial [Anaerolineae bacterium]
FVFLDTETTGLAGGSGTYAFLVGVGRYDGETFRLLQFFMRDPIEEPALLAALTELLAPLDALVTFNGKAFDVPLLNARYITNRAATPFKSVPHLDLLPLARRLWRDRLESRALKSLETHILGVARSEEEVPGFLIPQIYFDYLRNGDARPLKRVLYHNAMDVVAMAALLGHIAQMLDNPIEFATEHGLDIISIGKLFEDLGRLDDAARIFARGLEFDLPEESFRQTSQRLAIVHRRRGEMPAAIELWRDAAGHRQIYAHVELAKYYEHKARDYDQAAEWTRSAITIVRESSPTTRREWLGALEHRLKRLESRQRKK